MDAGFYEEDITTVAELSFPAPPSLAASQANVATLQNVLHMSDKQVCYDALAACVAMQVIIP